MLGSLRLVLALMVVVTHMFYPYWFGHYAVFGFFIISGYLMTLVMNRVYGYSLIGRGRYLINRIFRIYPLYLFVVVVSSFSIYFIGNESASFNASLRLPVDWLGWVRNIVIVGIEHDYYSRLIPPAWALGIELVFYFLIGLGISRTKWITQVWFAVSLAYTLFMVIEGASFEDRYFSILAASLPFSIGALMFFYKDEALAISRKVNWFVIACIAIYVFISPVLTLIINESEFLYGVFNPHGFVMYVNIAFMSLLFSKCMNADLPSYQYLDKMFGELSYPVYLTHWLVGMYLAKYLFSDMARGSLPLMLVTVITTLLISLGIVYLFERPLEVLRDSIRGKGRV